MAFKFTVRERTLKNKTIGEAVNIAAMILGGRTRGICINALKGRSLDEKITIEELNRISDQIVDDSRFYD